tara:strand:+ start:126 stop:548 length:423 start_codon:yes stop_codon:yes gene_type:complete
MSGIIWAVLSGLSFGLFQTFNRKASLRKSVFYQTFYLMLISTFVVVMATLAIEDINQIVLLISWQSIFYFAVAGMIHFVIGWTLFAVSQKVVGASRTSALLGTAPLFATLIGYLIFNEILSFLTLTGITLIMIGIYLVAK